MFVARDDEEAERSDLIVANEISELDERARKLRRFSRVTALPGELTKHEESGRTAPLIAVGKSNQDLRS